MSAEDVIKQAQYQVLCGVRSLLPDERVLALATAALEWVVDSEIFGASTHPSTPAVCARELAVAATFVRLCSPRSADGTQQELCVRLVLLFLWLDDVAGDDAIDEQEWLVFQRELEIVAHEGRSTYSRGHREWWALLLDLDELGGKASRSRAIFRHALASFFAALGRERDYRKRAVDWATYWSVRRETIFVKVFVDFWRSCKGIELDASEEQNVALLRDLACEITTISNDIASVVRERADEDLNVVFILEREKMISAVEATELSIVLHNTKVSAYLDERLRVRNNACSGGLDAYIGILDGQINGNLDSMVALGHRYPKSTPLIEKLWRV